MSAHKYSYRITDAMLVAMHADQCLQCNLYRFLLSLDQNTLLI